MTVTASSFLFPFTEKEQDITEVIHLCPNVEGKEHEERGIFFANLDMKPLLSDPLLLVLPLMLKFMLKLVVPHQFLPPSLPISHYSFCLLGN